MSKKTEKVKERPVFLQLCGCVLFASTVILVVGTVLEYTVLVIEVWPTKLSDLLFINIFFKAELIIFLLTIYLGLGLLFKYGGKDLYKFCCKE